MPYTINLARSKDFLYDNVDLLVWVCIETGLSISASSAVTLKPLFQKSSPRDNSISRQLTPKLNTINFATDGTDSSAGTKDSESQAIAAHSSTLK